MIAELAVVALLEPFEDREAGSIATVLIAFDDGESYEVEWGDMSGATSTVPASKLRVVSQQELDAYIHITDPETFVIRRLASRLGMSPEEVVRDAVRREFERGSAQASEAMQSDARR